MLADTEVLLRAIVTQVMLAAMIRNAPRLAAQAAAVRAAVEAQPSPATWYLQKWHNRC